MPHLQMKSVPEMSVKIMACMGKGFKSKVDTAIIKQEGQDGPRLLTWPIKLIQAIRPLEC
jgi:hypothetical protein